MTIKNFCSSLTSLKQFLLSFPAETKPWHFSTWVKLLCFLRHNDISLGYQKVIFLCCFYFPFSRFTHKIHVHRRREVFQIISVSASSTELSQGWLSANEAEAAAQLLHPQSRVWVVCSCHLSFAGYSSAHSRSAFLIFTVHMCGCEHLHLIPLLLRPVQGCNMSDLKIDPPDV